MKSILLCALALSCSVAVLAKAPANTKKAKSQPAPAAAQAEPAKKLPVITFTEITHDFGTIAEENGPATYVFEFTNTGNADLLISNVIASCGCTTPDWTKTPIAPKGKGSVTVTYNPANRPGAFTKTITVSSNVENEKNLLTIKGEVTPKKQ